MTSALTHPISERRALKPGEARARTKADPPSPTPWKPNVFLQATIDALSSNIAILDEVGTVRAVNAAWRKGANGAADKGGGIGSPYGDLLRRAVGDPKEAGIVARGLGGVLSGARRHFTHVSSIDAGARWLQIRIGAFSVFGSRRAVVAHEDVSDARRLDQELKRIAGQLLDMQDSERRRIARDLHDSTSQHLTALGLGLARVEQAAADRPEAIRTLREMRASLEEAHREIRITTYLLHPPALAKGGLAPAIRRFASGFARRTGLEIACETPNDFSLDQAEAEAALFRVMQEALTNVHRHACARRVAVRLLIKSGLAILEVEDDGVGIEEAAHWDVEPALGVGVPGMQARMSQFGGALDIRSGPRGGTLVRAALPLGRKTKPRVAEDAPPAHGA